jgi:glyoxylase-like metal-dependent hydrolase (beta-lactamase superfamily II)
MRKLVMATALLAACGGSQSKIKREGGIVQMFKQGRLAQNANVYWFDTPAGPVVVDVPLTVSDAKSLKSAMKVVPYRIYVTSARPERFASLPEMRKGDVSAFTTPAIATEIQNHGNQRLAPYHAKAGGDVPAHVEPPSPAVEERTHDMVGEVELELLPLGPAESESSLAIFIAKTGELLTGDVVAGGEHLDLTWGRSVQWQDRIKELKALEPKHVYPGHGTPGGPELLDQTAEYLKYFHETVGEKVKPGAPAKITPADLADVKRKMTQRFPKHGRPELLDKSIPAEYAVQLAALPPQPAPEAQPPQPGATPPATGTAPTPPPPATTTTPPPASSSDDLLESVPSKKKKK